MLLHATRVCSILDIPVHKCKGEHFYSQVLLKLPMSESKKQIFK